MLRITRIDTPAEQGLILEGRLIEPWTEELSSQWEQMCRAGLDRKFIIDLRGVTRIDGAGRSVLTRLKNEGALLLARGVWIKYLVEDLNGKSAGPKSPNRLTHASERSSNERSR